MLLVSNRTISSVSETLFEFIFDNEKLVLKSGEFDNSEEMTLWIYRKITGYKQDKSHQNEISLKKWPSRLDRPYMLT